MMLKYKTVKNIIDTFLPELAKSEEKETSIITEHEAKAEEQS